MSCLRWLVLIAIATSITAHSASQARAATATVVIAQGVDPTTLDPMNHQEAPATVLANNLLEGLIDPRLKLRGSSAFTPLTHVEIVDPFTVRVHSKAGWPLLPAVLTTGQAAMLPPRYYREKEMPYLQKNPVGSGPFKFVRWVKDDRIELEANEQYWRGAPRIKRLIFKPIPDDAVRVAALQNGEVDIAVNIPPHLAGLIANHPKLFLSTAPSTRTIQLLYYTHQYDAQHK